MTRPNTTERLQGLIDQYIGSGQPWPATARQLAAWALDRKLWAPSGDSLLGQCADQFARAMREEYFTDSRGRLVRAKHVARRETPGEKQLSLSLWADIRTADRDHMEIAFRQRRHQIVGDCRQLKSDVDFFNEFRIPPGAMLIQLVIDFTDDVAEIEALDPQPPPKPSPSGPPPPSWLSKPAEQPSTSPPVPARP